MKNQQRSQELCWGYHQQARDLGFQVIAGVDEAGRGPLAGPVVAAACVLPDGFFLGGIDDSKKLKKEKRETLFAQIIGNEALDYGIGVVRAERIDEINILQATFQAMCLAIKALKKRAEFALVDGSFLPPELPCPGSAIVKGDSLELSIMAASIIAKCTRDEMMRIYHEQWPYYGFAAHQGYGTALHMKAIEEFGPCPIHRRSFAPLKYSKGEE